MLTHHSPTKFPITQSSTHFSRTARALLTEPISTRLSPQRMSHDTEIVKDAYHKTYSQHVRRICGLHIFSVDGREVLLMEMYGMMQGTLTLQCQKENIFLLMLGFLLVMLFWYHIEESDIIFENGVKQIKGKFYVFSKSQHSNKIIIDQKIKKSYSTFVMLKLETLLSGYLEC